MSNKNTLEQWIIAGKTDDLKLLKKLSRSGIDPNLKCFGRCGVVGDYRKSIIFKVKCGASLRILSKAGANLMSCDPLYHNTLMHHAMKGNIGCVKILLKKGIPLHESTIFGDAAQQLATDGKHYECAKIIEEFIQFKFFNPIIYWSLSQTTRGPQIYKWLLKLIFPKYINVKTNKKFQLQF